MMHYRTSFALCLLAIVLAPLLPSHAQLPPVIGDSPNAVHPLYLPQVQVGPDNRGVTNFGCVFGQAVNYTWFVSQAGTLQSDWLFVNATGQIQWLDRILIAPQRGFVATRMIPSSGWRISRVSWSYTGTAQTVSWSCG